MPAAAPRPRPRMRQRLHPIARRTAGLLSGAAVLALLAYGSAILAGYRPLVADSFDDSDTRDFCVATRLVEGDLEAGFNAGSLIAALEALAKGEAPCGLVYGAGFEDRATACAARAERAVGRVVEGSCEVPVGAYAAVRGETFEIEAFVGMPDGSRLVRKSASGACAEAERVGDALGEQLLAAGGRDILRALQASPA